MRDPPRIQWLKVAKPAFDYLSFEEADRLPAITAARQTLPLSR
jgi:hypothetical protein